ncbi:MAG: hypothetical protein ACHQ7M_09385 [Chloroflexota bacterium]
MLAEHNLYTRFHELTRERMTLLISHRCSTVRMADRILVLEHGRIVEDGSHAALPALGGRHATLYATQAGRYRYDDVGARGSADVQHPDVRALLAAAAPHRGDTP